jgi:hypothetical protein
MMPSHMGAGAFYPQKPKKQNISRTTEKKCYIFSQKMTMGLGDRMQVALDISTSFQS